MLATPIPKERFKRLAKSKILEYWQALLRAEAAPMSSLMYFKPELYSLSRAHYMWTTAAGHPFESSKSTVLAKMVSGRFRSEALCRHWSANRHGYCRAPSCHQVYGTLEHLLVSCPALDTVREGLYSMWLERSVIFLHYTLPSEMSWTPMKQLKFNLFWNPWLSPFYSAVLKSMGKGLSSNYHT